MSFPARLLARFLGVTVLITGLVAAAPAASVSASEVVTPGSFTGYGFDKCTAPTQEEMDAWLTSSPYWAVGIYISGDSRGCPDQPNLDAAWVDTQLAHGWRLLPVTLGPQASCTTRPAYLDDVRIDPDPTDGYAAARAQGRAEAATSVQAAQDYGLASGSTLWYDIEAFDITNTACRDSALWFLSAWTRKLHALGWVSGVYSSAGSGITMLDDARVHQPGVFAMPDQVWFARWNGEATVDTTYIRADGWTPHRRVHQYLGGHDETFGGVTMRVDSDFVDLGRGSVPAPQPKHCGGVSIDFPDYTPLQVGARGAKVKAVQCLLREQRRWSRPIDGSYSSTLGAVVRKYRVDHGLAAFPGTNRRTWMVLLSRGSTPLLKYGSFGPAVRRLQRTLNAADPPDSTDLAISGTFEGTSTAAVKAYQADRSLPKTGVVTTDLWALLQAAAR